MAGYTGITGEVKRMCKTVYVILISCLSLIILLTFCIDVLVGVMIWMLLEVNRKL